MDSAAAHLVGFGEAHRSADLAPRHYELRIGQATAAQFGQSVSLPHSDVPVDCGRVASDGNGEKSPRRGYAFEFVLAVVVERQTRTGHEIDDGS